MGEVKKAVKGKSSETKNKKDFHLRNVLREDSKPHETGIYTDKLLEQAPNKGNNYIKVKKIL